MLRSSTIGDKSPSPKTRKQVSDAIMSHNGGPVPLAAGGVVAEFINGLHAKRARNLIGDNGGAESIRSSDSEDLRFHDRVSSIEEGRDGSDPCTCVRLRVLSRRFLSRRV